MIQENQLREAAMIANEAILKKISEYDLEGIKSSPLFEKKIQRLLRRYQIIQQARKIVAAILVVMLIGGGVLLTIKPEVAAVIWGWLVEKYDDFTYYYFSGETDADHSAYAPQWLPDGYTLLMRNETESETFYIYSNDKNEWIQFACISGTEGGEFFVFSDSTICTEIKVKENLGWYYQATVSTETDGLTWTDVDNDLLFYLTGDIDSSILIKIAESVSNE